MNPLTTLASMIEEALDKSGLPEREVEALTGINRNTLKRRLVKPGDFSIDELDAVARFMGAKYGEDLLTEARKQVSA